MPEQTQQPQQELSVVDRSFRSWLSQRPERLSPSGFSNGAMWMFRKEYLIENQWQSACHYSLRSFTQVGGDDHLALGINYAEANDASIPYLKWLTGRTSPWYKLFGKGKSEIIIENGVWKAIRFYSCHATDYNLLKNFAIALRMVGEKPYKIRVWDSLTKAGLHPNEAFFVSSFFSGETNGVITFRNYELNCDHWPISIHKVDFNRFVRKNPNNHFNEETGRFYTNGLNIVWGDLPARDYRVAMRGYLGDLNNKLSLATSQQARGAFARGTGTYRVEDIIKVYTEWKKRNGLKGIRTRKTVRRGDNVQDGGVGNSPNNQ